MGLRPSKIPPKGQTANRRNLAGGSSRPPAGAPSALAFVHKKTPSGGRHPPEEIARSSKVVRGRPDRASASAGAQQTPRPGNTVRGPASTLQTSRGTPDRALCSEHAVPRQVGASTYENPSCQQSSRPDRSGTAPSIERGTSAVQVPASASVRGLLSPFLRGLLLLRPQSPGSTSLSQPPRSQPQPKWPQSWSLRSESQPIRPKPDSVRFERWFPSSRAQSPRSRRCSLRSQLYLPRSKPLLQRLRPQSPRLEH